jgi:hypothetical protein
MWKDNLMKYHDTWDLVSNEHPSWTASEIEEEVNRRLYNELSQELAYEEKEREYLYLNSI